MLNNASALRTTPGSLLWLVFRPVDILPPYLAEIVALDATDFENTLITFRVGGKNEGGFLKHWSRSNYDLAVVKLSCTSLSQLDWRSFGRWLHSVDFIHHEDADIVPTKVTRRLRCDNFQAAAWESARQHCVSVFLFQIAGQRTIEDCACCEGWLDV
jgi:hypothetical protein